MRFIPSLMCLALAGCATTAPPSQVAAYQANQPPMSMAHAASVLQSMSTFIQNGGWGFTDIKSPPRVTATQLEIDFVNGAWVCDFAANPNPPVNSHMLADPPTSMDLRCDGGSLQAWGSMERNLERANAWRTMQTLGAPESPGERARFQSALQQFLAQQVGPTPGEEIRMYKVAAEAAVRDKRLWDAVDQFEQALGVAPWWPQGNYNIALIYAELHAYGRAARYMQRYIQLVPNAANARIAQDKVYEWQSAAQRSGA